MIRMGDNPSLVSTDFLSRLDKELPGRYLAQTKYDGWRRMAWNIDNTWQYAAKPGGSGELKDLPISLRAEFESLNWPDGIGLDMEYMGLRQVAHISQARLMVFDLLMLNGVWQGDKPFAERHGMLSDLMQSGIQSQNVQLVETWPNPGLVDRFLMQMQDPLSEGLVVRRADSTLIGALNKCADNPLVWKCKYRDVKGGKSCVA